MSMLSTNTTPPPGQQVIVAGTSRVVAYVLFYTFLANIPFLLASRQMGILRNGWLGLEYIAAGIVTLYLPRAFSPILFLIALSIDLLEGVCETYFLSPRACLTNLNALGDLPSGRIGNLMLIVAVTLLALASVWVLQLSFDRRSKRRIALALTVVAVLCVSIDVVSAVRSSGHLPGMFHPSHWSSTPALPPEERLTRLSSVRMIRAVLAPAPAGFFMPGATSQVLGSALPQNTVPLEQRPNIVLILIESWGQATDLAIRSHLVQPFEQPQLTARYQIVQGTSPFHGSTVAGEARELCSSTMGFHIIEAAASELNPCLPHRVALLGYQVLSVHGMNGDFYHRLDWYKRAGFEETWFHPELQAAGLPSCPGSFGGTCDPAIASWIAGRLAGDQHHPRPDFVYWVTLNSHLPVIVPAPLKDPASCTFSPLLTQQPQLCSWYQLLAALQQSAAKLAAADTGRPTIFILVGDHAPPFASADLRSQFSPSRVPYLALIPRELKPISAH